MDLRLRPFRIADEPVARAAHEELAEENFPFLLRLSATSSMAPLEYFGGHTVTPSDRTIDVAASRPRCFDKRSSSRAQKASTRSS